MKKLWLLLCVISCFAQNTPIYPTRAAAVADLTVATNNATTTLTLSAGTGDTSFTVASTVGFTAPVLLFIDLEEVKCTGLTATSFTGCTRGFDNTTVASHSISAAVGNFVAAYMYNQVAAEVISIEGELIGGLQAAHGGTGQTAALNNKVLIGNGTTWLAVTLGDCQDTAGNHLNYTAATHTVSCGNSGGGGGGGGSVTSVGLAIPNSIFTISGSPVTGAGTLTATPSGTSGGIPYFSGSNSMASSAALGANLIIVGGGAGVSPTTLVNNGSTTTILHGNGAGLASFSGVMAADFAAGVLSGNGTKIVSTTGALTSTHCVSIDVNGNFVDNGTVCAPAPAFSAITGDTNTTAAMVVGSGASLTFSGTGTINASGINGTAVAASSAADQFLGTTSSGVGAWVLFPNCNDTGGSHLNYDTATHTMTCGNTANPDGPVGPAGGVLTGTYPNPSGFAAGSVLFADLDPGMMSGNTTRLCTAASPFTNTAVLVFDVQGNCAASSATIDSSGNLVITGSLTTNSGGTGATVMAMSGGTQSLTAAPTNSAGFIGPPSPPSGKHFWDLGAVGASANNQFWLCSAEASNITSCALTTLALTGDVTSVAQATTLSSTFKQRAFGFSFDGAGNAIANNTLSVTAEVPYACTIAAFDISADTGTITIDVAKVATGTTIPAFPTNSITASATPALATGNNFRSTTLTGWTTSVALHDIVQAKVTAVSGATKASLTIECNQ